MKKIFVAQPIHGGSRYEEIHRIQDIIQSTDFGEELEFTFCAIGGGSVAIARNQLAYQLLTQTRCDGMLTADMDIPATADHIRRILSHGEIIVGGAYPLKRIPSRWVYSPLPGKRPNSTTGLMECKEVGTGFKYFPRACFEQAIAAHPEIEYTDDHSKERRTMWDFFCHRVVNGRLLTEDYFFDQMMRKLGWSIFVDTKCQLGHMGAYTYTSGCVAAESDFPPALVEQFEPNRKDLFQTTPAKL